MPDKAAEPGRPTLRLGSKGNDVRELQEMLLQAGESLPRFGADGDFGSETLAAVRSFQRKHQLAVDGVVGKNTWAKLIEQASGQTPAPAEPAVPLYIVHIPNLTEQQAESLLAQYSGAWKASEGSVSPVGCLLKAEAT